MRSEYCTVTVCGRPAGSTPVHYLQRSLLKFTSFQSLPPGKFRGTTSHHRLSTNSRSLNFLEPVQACIGISLPSPLPLPLPNNTRLPFPSTHGKNTGLEWPRGFQEVKVSRFHNNGTRWWKCCQPYAPAAFTPRKCSWYSFLLEAESTPGPQCYRKDFMPMTNSNDTSWDRTSDLPICSTES